MDGGPVEAPGTHRPPLAQGVRSSCPYCGVGCGVLLQPDGQGGLTVRGDPDHPANAGRLCSKGAALAETLGLGQRLLAPRVNGQEAGWDEALQLVADRFRQVAERHGPDAVGFYVSGQLLTEDYYVANKLMKGFIGSANIDTNSRLCMASTVAGHRRAFGTDTVPGTYDDIDQADLVVLVGSNLAWCHPVLYQRLMKAREARGTRVVVIDPRRTASCDGADMHLALAPGSDVALFNRLFAAICDGGHADRAFLRRTTGLAATLRAARAETGAATGLAPAQIEAFCKLWLGTPRVVTVFSQGVNQSTSGTDKVNAILNCHLAAGRIGSPGCGPFSVTGQTNAMGGREVGGLANSLACHMGFEDPAHRGAVQAFWNAPRIADKPGLKAVDMFQAARDGRLKALWIIHTNPAVSMPDADRVREAIAGCEFTVVSDITDQTDTARLADVVLPAAAWAEKSGTITNSDRTISRQRAVLPAPGQARPDWAILAEVGRRMGWREAFDYASPAAIFREHAALSGVAGGFGLDFDISGLARISDAEYAAMAPARWPVSAARQGGRFFGDGRFFHGDGKARLVPVSHRAPAAMTGPKHPFRLNTGRSRDQWHTMTRTGLSPRLAAHAPEPMLDIHPDDAARLGLAQGDLAELRAGDRRAILKTRLTLAQRAGGVFAPMHWTAETAPSARINRLVAAAIDPVSGQPESKAAVVSVAPIKAEWHAFAVSSQTFTPRADYWARVPSAAGFRAEIAGLTPVADWEATARAMFGLPRATLSSVTDPARGIIRLALEQDGALAAALFVSSTPVAVMRDHVASLPGARACAVLAGRVAADAPDPGPTVCACFGVGANTIAAAGLSTVEAVGAVMKAGTNCGACRPEIAALLARGRKTA